MRPSFLRRVRAALAALLPALLLASPAVQADTYTYDVFGNLGDSGVNAIENGLLRLKEAVLRAFRAGTRR